jgi:hypothetical protein
MHLEQVSIEESATAVQSDYMLLNFNDVPSAMVLMVQLLVVNNWHVFTEAFVVVGGPSAWLFFISFYGVGVVAGTLHLLLTGAELSASAGTITCFR